MRRTTMGLAIAAATLASGGALTPVAESRERKPREPEPEPEPKPAAAIPTDIPDRVSLEEDSPHYFPHWRRIGVRYNGGECQSVVEFCVSEGWMRSQVFHGGRPKQERGRFVTVTRSGTIEPYWRARA